MITKIGIVAGDIWSYLEEQGSVAEMDDLVRELKKEKELVLMSVGWLAREGHIESNYHQELYGHVDFFIPQSHIDEEDFLNSAPNFNHNGLMPPTA